MLLVGTHRQHRQRKVDRRAAASERGATIIDADVLARRAVELGHAGLRAIVERWGPTSSRRTASRSRARCDASSSATRTARSSSTQIVHPEVERLRDAARRRGAQARRPVGGLRHSAAVRAAHDRPRSTGSCSSTRRAPCVSSGWCRIAACEETEAMDMIAAQMPAELKRARADLVIDNDGTLTQLDARVARGVGRARARRRSEARRAASRRASLTLPLGRPIDSAPSLPTVDPRRSTSCPTSRRTCCTPRTTST